MKIIIAISLVSLVLSVLGDRRNCKLNKSKVVVCEDAGLITRVFHPADDNNLTLDLNGSSTIQRNAFKNVNNWQLQLILPEEGAPHTLSLESGSFRGVGYTTNLDIQNANIVFDGNPWEDLGDLAILRCKNCGFTEVPTEILESFPKLEELYLEDHRIDVIHENAFASLKNLTVLTLTREKPITLEPGWLNGLDQLEELTIAANSFTLAPGIFDGLKKLDTLRLRGKIDNSTIPKIYDSIKTLTNLEVD
uniref:Lgr4_1 protein n=1 Tax=Fopius arisanus TaxID=64838 RepID=A0A0C9QN13_9HYME